MDRQNAFREQEMNMGIKVKKILTGAALIMSLGIFTALALAMTVARRELLLGSPLPPVLTATIISRAILVNI